MTKHADFNKFIDEYFSSGAMTLSPEARHHLENVASYALDEVSEPGPMIGWNHVGADISRAICETFAVYRATGESKGSVLWHLVAALNMVEKP